MAASASFLTIYVIQYSMPGGDTSNGQSGAVAPPSSTFHQITPPKYLDLKHSGEIAENWKLWKEKYNNYFVISRLDRETPEFQLAMFKHTIGDDALKVIKTFNYAEGENSSDWRVLMEKMEKHCIGEVNEIYERYFRRSPKKGSKGWNVLR